MNNVALIGAGQLGSRHLQGLAKTGIDINIEVVEPYEASRETAKQRYEEVPLNQHIKSIQFYENIDRLSDVLDIVIIATNADVRSKVVQELLSKKKVRYLILEKVLFQTIEEFDAIKNLLNEKNTKCWVNHPRRMFPFYQELKKELADCKKVIYSMNGGNWGLGCNSLHLLDHLSFLTDSTDIEISNKLLNEKIYNTKRVGYIEFNGELKGKIGNHHFSLHCHEEFTPSIITLSSENIIAIIDETKGFIRIAKKNNNWEWEIIEDKIVYFQSELSNKIVEDLLQKQNCILPTYSEAIQLHIPFIQALLDHMEKVDGQKHTICPIT